MDHTRKVIKNETLEMWNPNKCLFSLLILLSQRTLPQLLSLTPTQSVSKHFSLSIFVNLWVSHLPKMSLTISTHENFVNGAFLVNSFHIS